LRHVCPFWTQLKSVGIIIAVLGDLPIIVPGVRLRRHFDATIPAGPVSDDYIKPLFEQHGVPWPRIHAGDSTGGRSISAF